MSACNEKWASPNNLPKPVAEENLTSAKRSLGIRFPENYRCAVLAVGLPRPTIALLDAIVGRELSLHSLGDFYSPPEIVEHTKAWHDLGMPKRLIAFANDDCANKFCFDTQQLNGGSSDKPAIWIFDHDFETVEKVADSFETWIDSFCQIEPWPEANDK